MMIHFQENRKMADIRDENGRKERLYLFYDGESVSGKVSALIGGSALNVFIEINESRRGRETFARNVRSYNQEMS